MNGLNLLQHNRLMTHLQHQEDKRYFLGALIFCKLAEARWAAEELKSTIKHGYAHISNLLGRTDELLLAAQFDLSRLSPKHLFILLASIYAHDLGMVAYYGKMFSALDGKNVLSKDEEAEVRRYHSKIIERALTDFDTPKKARGFFGNDVINQMREIVSNCESTLLDETLQMIVDERRKIALICLFHNNPKLIELRTHAHSLKINTGLVIQENELDTFMFLAACLQFVDAIDMAINRVDRPVFTSLLKKLDETPNPKTGILFSYDDVKLMEKMFLCYLIDGVELSTTGQILNYQYRMSLRAADIEAHAEQIKHCKDIYLNRLTRHEHDCATIIENFLHIKIFLTHQEDMVQASESKSPIGPTFFNWVNRSQPNTIDQLLDSRMTSAAGQDSIFSYLKLYAACTDTFFDATSIGIRGDKQMRRTIESYFFKRSEWNISLEPKCIVLRKQEFKTFPKDGVDVSGYMEYFAFMRDKKISYEVYYGLGDGRGNFIGFVNLHYSGSLSREEEDTLKHHMDDSLGDLGVDISAYHYEQYLKEVVYELRSWQRLSDADKDALISLTRHRFDRGYDFSTLCVGLSMSEMRKLLSEQPGEQYESDYYCVVNTALLDSVYAQAVREQLLSNIVQIDTAMHCSADKRYASLHLKFRIADPVYEDYLIQAYSFLRSYSNKVDTHDPTVKRYFFPFKVYVNALGGKILVDLEENNQVLSMEVRFPLHTQAEIRNLGLRLETHIRSAPVSCAIPDIPSAPF